MAIVEYRTESNKMFTEWKLLQSPFDDTDFSLAEDSNLSPFSPFSPFSFFVTKP